MGMLRDSYQQNLRARAGQGRQSPRDGWPGPFASSDELPSSVFEQMQKVLDGDKKPVNVLKVAPTPPPGYEYEAQVPTDDSGIPKYALVPKRQPPSTAKPASFWDRVQGAAEHLQDATIRGVKEGWNPSDPLGYDPETKMRLHEAAMAHPALRPVEAFNNVIGYPATAAADAALRVGNVALHGGAALAGQAANEVGLGNGRALERDLLGIAEMSAGSAGGLAGMPERISTRAAVARPVAEHMASQAAERADAAAKTAKVWSDNPQWLWEYPTSRQFVKTSDGSIDWGYIGPETVMASDGRQAEAVSRVQKGLSGEKGWGARHQPDTRHEEAQQLGYENAFGPTEETMRGYDHVAEQMDRDGLLLLKKHEGGPNHYVAVRYQEPGWFQKILGKNEPFYSFTTGFFEDASNVGKLRREYWSRKLKKGEINVLK